MVDYQDIALFLYSAFYPHVQQLGYYSVDKRNPLHVSSGDCGQGQDKLSYGIEDSGLLVCSIQFVDHLLIPHIYYNGL